MSVDPREQEERATQDQAALMKLPYCDTRVEGTVQPLNNVMDAPSMQHYHAVPLRMDEAHLFIGITVKTPKSTIEEIKSHFQSLIVNMEVISESAYKEVLARYTPRKQVDMGVINVASAGASMTLEDVSQKLEQVRADEAFRFIMTQAIALNASDVHIEPGREAVRVRFRIDGMLHQVAMLSHDKHSLLEMELAKRANIKRMVAQPQGGRFSQAYIDANGQPQSMNMRVETMPVLFGSEAVIRLFNLDKSMLKLEKLQLDDSRREHVEALLSHPYGMALVVGPTGSGKTTMLYTFINELNTPQRKIVTLEDPIEYELDGISQVPVYPDDENFGTRLQAVLREDPDVIMIGEIRNYDTAKTALQAALTGHLVLSTFHAGSAAAALTRLLDMIGHNPLLSSAVRMIVAQRLLRKLCNECKKPTQPNDKLKQMITNQLNNLPEKDQVSAGDLQIYEAAGCKVCKGIGYDGRIAVREMLVITPEFEALIARNGAAMSTQDFEQEAMKRGMRTLLQDAILQLVAGNTSLEELSRTVDIR